MKKITKKHSIYILTAFVILIILSFFFVPKIFGLKYVATNSKKEINPIENIKTTEPVLPKTAEDNIIVTHLQTPKSVKAIYVTSWVAGNTSFREKIIKMIDEKELNAVIIDVKDTTGKISFKVNDPELKKMNSAENRIQDIKTFIDTLHKKNIYVIGRIATFQDPYLAKKWPMYAVKTTSDKTFWKDDKCKREIRNNHEDLCTYWLDAGTKEVWDYVARIGDEAYADGFDEINYDYIRYPADGNMKDIYFPVSNGQIKSDVMNNFTKFLHDHFAGIQNEKILRPKISADIFGLATTDPTDLGIGQLLIPFATNLDYIMPMVYPSHFAPDTYGYKNPAVKPYEIVNFSMKKAVERLKLAQLDPMKLRPWLQDFDMGAKYTAAMVRTQIQATYDAGLVSWALWDPANTYTTDALLPKEKNN